ncbi:hypothetical protein RIR_jg42524.t1 [Rhizophagus irregularis DAOM 181602=DAOM 197198]|nr:hypothetical protein RIR_jg42524.t1 [Rhizophagus irregularis DAOM 181602=DAOM 197198]
MRMRVFGHIMYCMTITALMNVWISLLRDMKKYYYIETLKNGYLCYRNSKNIKILDQKLGWDHFRKTKAMKLFNRLVEVDTQLKKGCLYTWRCRKIFAFFESCTNYLPSNWFETSLEYADGVHDLLRIVALNRWPLKICNHDCYLWASLRETNTCC